MEVRFSRTIISTSDLGRWRTRYAEALGLKVYREYASAGVIWR
jgi:hypothetical protein